MMQLIAGLLQPHVQTKWPQEIRISQLDLIEFRSRLK